MVTLDRHGSAWINVKGAPPRYDSHRPDGKPRPIYKNDSVDVPPRIKAFRRSILISFGKVGVNTPILGLSKGYPSTNLPLTYLLGNYLVLAPTQ